MESTLFTQYSTVLSHLATSTAQSQAGDSSAALTSVHAAQAIISTIAASKIADRLRDHNVEIATTNQNLFNK
jgi:hypothetical protein